MMTAHQPPPRHSHSTTAMPCRRLHPLPALPQLPLQGMRQLLSPTGLNSSSSSSSVWPMSPAALPAQRTSYGSSLTTLQMQAPEHSRLHSYHSAQHAIQHVLPLPATLLLQLQRGMSQQLDRRHTLSIHSMLNHLLHRPKLHHRIKLPPAPVLHRCTRLPLLFRKPVSLLHKPFLRQGLVQQGRTRK